MRRVLSWAALVAIGLLAGLSVIGAFMGAERARAMFNSAPMIGCWVLLAGLFVAGLVSFKRLIRSPGLLAMHLGPLLILLGAMYGSDAGHRIAHLITGAQKVPTAYMPIFEGESSNEVMDQGLTRPIAGLPFSLRLIDFWMEHYQPADKTWLLYAVVPCSGQDCSDPPAGGQPEECQTQTMESMQTLVKWSVGQEVEIPSTGATLKVVEYLDGARPVYAEAARAVLEVTRPDGQKTLLPAEEGREVSLEDPKLTVRIAQVFSHLLVRGSGSDLQVVDVPGSDDNPALKVEIEEPDGTKHYTYVIPGFSMHGEENEEVGLAYSFPRPVGAEPDPDAALPAMKLLLAYNGKEQEEWLIPGQEGQPAMLPLSPLLGQSDEADPPDGGSEESALYLVQPVQQVKDFKSDVAVLEEGQTTARKVIEVNHPLHYGGYHFYQHSYDDVGGQYTILLVKSDSGLRLVYGGFLLLGAGVFWWCWARPALSRLGKRRSNGA